MISSLHGEVEEAIACSIPVQLPYRVVSQIPLSHHEGWGSEVCGAVDTVALRVEVGRCIGAECAGGSRARSSKYTAEAFDMGAVGYSKGKNGHKAFQELSGAEEQTVLGR
jgi:hypothetical protein